MPFRGSYLPLGGAIAFVLVVLVLVLPASLGQAAVEPSSALKPDSSPSVVSMDRTGRASTPRTTAAPLRPAGTPTWNVSCTPCTISGRQYASMVYDAKDGYDLLFGGLYESPADVQPGDTWTYVGGTWTNITSTACPSGCPSPRFGSAMAYDAADGYVLLFGGSNYWAGGSSGFLSDTWEFTGGVWTELSPSCSPSCPIGRYDASMTYDAADGYVLMFGGAGITWPGGVPLDDTWEYLGGTWTLISPSGGPSSRYGAGMTYDARDGYVLLYGGVENTGTPPLPAALSDTWEFLAGSWTELISSSSPGDLALINNMMVYDSSIGEVLLYGGATSVSPWGCTTNTWTYTGGAWSAPAVATDPNPARLGGSLADDPVDGTAVYFSGWDCNFPNTDPDDTWTYYPGYPVLTVSLTATPSATDVGYPVVFSISAYGGTPPYTEALRFGDGTATLAPTKSTVWHNYTAAGTYVATLWVNDSSTGRATSVATVTIHALPKAAPSATPSPADVGVSVAFSAGITGGTPSFHENWTFGDGARVSTNNPTHTYTARGNYTVHLWSNDSFGKPANGSFTETINGAPGVTASASPTTVPLGGYVHFNATTWGGTPAFTFAWRFGDGGSGSGASTSHPFATSGTYTVWLWANDSGGGHASTQVVITVLQSLTTPTLHASLSPVDAHENVVFSATYAGGTPPYATLWRFGDGGSSPSSTATHAFAAAGRYTVWFWVNDSASHSASASIVEVVNPVLTVASFTANFAPGAGHVIDLGDPLNVTVVTAGGTAPVSYAYSGAPTGCTPGSGAQWSCIPTATGNYTIEATVTDVTGAVATGNLTLSVDTAISITSFSSSAPQVSLGAGVLLEVRTSGGTAPLTYSYPRLPAGCSSQDLASLPCYPSEVPTSGDAYAEVEVVDADGAHAFSNLTPALAVNPDPRITTFETDPTDADSGQSVQFVIDATGGTGTLSASFSGLPAGCSQPPPTLSGGSCTPSSSGTFTVRLTVTDVDGRQANATLNLTVSGRPVISLAGLESLWWVWIPLVAALVLVAAFLVDRRRKSRALPAEATVGAAAAASVAPIDPFGGRDPEVVAPTIEGAKLADDDAVAREDTVAPIPGPHPEGVPIEPKEAPAPKAEATSAPSTPSAPPAPVEAAAPTSPATPPGPPVSGASSGGWRARPLRLEATTNPTPATTEPSPSAASDLTDVPAAAAVVSPASLPTTAPSPTSAAPSSPGEAPSETASPATCPLCAGVLDTSSHCDHCGITWRPDQSAG